MNQNASLVDLVNQNMISVKAFGVGHLSTRDGRLRGTTINPHGQEVTHFGSCSYLNLELDERLKAAAIDAVERYGIQFSCSRAYLALHLYEELEHLLSQVFGHPTIITPTSTLAHLANIPLLVSPSDAVVLDHQVHNSVQNAVKIAKSGGTSVEMVRHNNVEYLERRLQKLQTRHGKVWYMADGIYSMYGDEAPIAALADLLERYPQLHLYIDDAHGMSWDGPNGAGFALGKTPMHPRMVVATSLCKGFGAGGGATIFYDQSTADKIRNCGSTHIFSSPLQPAILNASIASAKIPLTPEIYQLQDRLKANVAYFQQLAQVLDLPLIDLDFTPIQYVGIGRPELALKLCQSLLERGYYTCVAGYPSVPYNNSGLRITLNQQHSREQIHGLLQTLSTLLDEQLATAHYNRDDIRKAFKSKQRPRALK